MCFVEAEFPLIGRPRLDGIQMFQRRSLAKALNQDGPPAASQIAELAERLVERFPAA